jgi:hypothetical protein
VRLAANDLDLDSAQQLLAFLESQSDLLRRQVGDRLSDPADVVRDWRVGIGGQLKADRPFQWESLQRQVADILPSRPHLRSTPRHY